ncbi:MAG: hypothetical protein ACREP6_14180 [Candidatus Binataceae bacterium]
MLLIAAAAAITLCGCGVAYQAGTQVRAHHMRDSLKTGETMPQVHQQFGEPDIRTDAGPNSEVWSYAAHPNSNDIAASLFYTSVKEGDKGTFIDLKFVGGKLASWDTAQHTMPSKRIGGITYGFTAGQGGSNVSHF